MPLLIGLLHQQRGRAHHGVRQHQARRRAARARRSSANGFEAQALSGDVPQNKRLRFLRDFHDGELAVLIATDVASRGLHIPDVSHVFNFDLPQDAAGLRAPHRPHRARRRRGRCDQLRLRGIRACRCPTSRAYVGHKIPFSPIAPELLAQGVVTAAPIHRHRPPARRGPPPRWWRRRRA